MRVYVCDEEEGALLPRRAAGSHCCTTMMVLSIRLAATPLFVYTCTSIIFITQTRVFLLNAGKPTKLSGQFIPNGDFKSTKKVTWLAKVKLTCYIFLVGGDDRSVRFPWGTSYHASANAITPRL